MYPIDPQIGGVSGVQEVSDVDLELIEGTSLLDPFRQDVPKLGSQLNSRNQFMWSTMLTSVLRE